MASREHGREQRPGAKPDPDAGSTASRTSEGTFDALRKMGDEDRGLSAAGRRLRELRNKRTARSEGVSPPPAPSAAGTPGRTSRERTFEVLDRPLPSEREEEESYPPRDKPAVTGRTPRAARTVTSPPRPPQERRTTPSPRRGAGRTTTKRTRPARGAVRRVKRTIKRVSPWSVLKMSLFFYSIVLVVWLVIVALLYSFIESLGVFTTVEELARLFTVEQAQDINLSLGLVEKWAFYIGGTVALVASLVNVLLAFFYNLGSDIVGGIEVTFVEREG